jgi:preprotein translocase subunit YajC
MNIHNFAIFLSAAPADGAARQPGAGDLFSMMLPILAMVAVFYFLLMRPQKKRAKAEKTMRDSLQIADEVVTAGGIIGRVLSVKDDTVLIETGSDRTRIRVLRSSIAENRTVHDS